MKPNRKAAREKAKAMRTRAEFDEWLDMLMLSDEERAIARMVYADCLSITQICFRTGYSRRQVQRKLAKVQDKMA